MERVKISMLAGGWGGEEWIGEKNEKMEHPGFWRQWNALHDTIMMDT